MYFANTGGQRKLADGDSQTRRDVHVANILNNPTSLLELPISQLSRFLFGGDTRSHVGADRISAVLAYDKVIYVYRQWEDGIFAIPTRSIINLSQTARTAQSTMPCA